MHNTQNILEKYELYTSKSPNKQQTLRHAYNHAHNGF